VEYRSIDEDEFDDFFITLSNAFGQVQPDPDELTNNRKRFERDRMFSAVEGGRIVGVVGVYSWRLTVPGGVAVPTAGVTTVGVLPSHRRRGIFRGLMRIALDQAEEREEAISALFASQAAIYPRFGYGTASIGYELDVLTERATFLPGHEPSGVVRLVPPDEALPLMHHVYESVAEGRPGMLRLSSEELAWFLFEPTKREDKPFCAVHLDEHGDPDAFSTYTIKHDWPSSLPHHELKARLTIASTPQASANLWRFLLDVDLVSHVTTWDRPADEPLFWLLEEPRAVRAKLVDGLHVRSVDVARALTARVYRTDGALMFSVSDPFDDRSSGGYRLTVVGGAASCEPSRGAPDIECGVADIGAVYLGGTTWRTLGRAGRVKETRPGALAEADTMFASDPPPWAPLLF
jgi:predicted acetyltransferase